MPSPVQKQKNRHLSPYGKEQALGGLESAITSTSHRHSCDWTSEEAAWTSESWTEAQDVMGVLTFEQLASLSLTFLRLTGVKSEMFM